MSSIPPLTDPAAAARDFFRELLGDCDRWEFITTEESGVAHPGDNALLITDHQAGVEAKIAVTDDGRLEINACSLDGSDTAELNAALAQAAGELIERSHANHQAGVED